MIFNNKNCITNSDLIKLLTITQLFLTFFSILLLICGYSNHYFWLYIIIIYIALLNVFFSNFTKNCNTLYFLSFDKLVKSQNDFKVLRSDYNLNK